MGEDDWLEAAYEDRWQIDGDEPELEPYLEIDDD